MIEHSLRNLEIESSIPANVIASLNIRCKHLVVRSITPSPNNLHLEARVTGLYDLTLKAQVPCHGKHLHDKKNLVLQVGK